MNELVSLFLEQGVSVRDIVKHGTVEEEGFINFEVQCGVETRGAVHTAQLQGAALKKYGKDFKVCSFNPDLPSQ